MTVSDELRAAELGLAVPDCLCRADEMRTAAHERSARTLTDEELDQVNRAGEANGFVSELGIRFVHADGQRVEALMPIEARIMQPHGFVHGGSTLALLETVASAGAELWCNLEVELPFGVDVHVRHRKSGRSGMVRGVARLDRTEPSRSGGVKQFWNVAAYDDAGDVMSDGVVMMKIVPKEYLARKAAQESRD